MITDKERVLEVVEKKIEHLKKSKENKVGRENLYQEKGKIEGFVECLRLLDVISYEDDIKIFDRVEEIMYGDVFKRVKEIINS